MVAVDIVVMVVLPRLSEVVPAPLVAIVLLTVFTPDVPLNLETLQIIAPYALAMALVGLMESLMTARRVDDITDTRSDKAREAWGKGPRTSSPGSSAAWVAAR